jgi:hypothetical protein
VAGGSTRNLRSPAAFALKATELMRPTMRMMFLASAATAALLSLPAQAAPLAQTTNAIAATSAVDQVAYRRCWFSHGERHCRWVGGVYGYNATRDVGSRRPEEFRTGSKRWWEAMDRQGRGGFGGTR